MYVITIISNKQKIELATCSKKLAEDLIQGDVLNSIIPIEKITTERSSSVNFKITHIKSNRNKVIFLKNKLTIQTASYEELTAFQIGFVIQAIFEKLCQINSAYGLHAACISKNGNALLLMGDAYSGKSSMALKLCRENNFEIVGDERCILAYKNNGTFALAGNKTLVLRKDFLQKTYPGLSFNGNKLGDTRLFLRPEKLKIKSNHSPVQVKAIFRINVGKFNRCNIIDAFDSTLFLFRAFSYQIRGINTPLISLDYVLQSLDNQQISSKRLKVAKNISEHIPMYEIHGSQKYLVANILKIFGE